MYVFVISLCIVAAAFVVQRFANQIDEQLNACGTGIFKDGTCECTHPYVGTHCEIVDCGYGKLIDSVFAYDTITTPKGPSGCECEAQYWGYNCAKCTSKFSGQCTGPCMNHYYGARCDILCKSGTENDATGVLHRDSGGTYNYFKDNGFCLRDGSVKCREGYAGAHCQHECLDCKYGSCNLDDGSCDCFDGYTGALCELTCPGRCSGLNGVCTQVNSQPVCDCYPGFTGEDCSLECCVEGRGTELGSVHGGCSSQGGCDCFDEVIPLDLPSELVSDIPFNGVGWQGPDCDCHENVTCGGRGRCVNGRCDCTANFQGLRCDICADDKIGPFCQYDRWQCPSETASHGEFVPTNSHGDYGCKCNSGFTGERCEECIEQAYPKGGADMCKYIIPSSLCHSGTVKQSYSGAGDMCNCMGHFDVDSDCAVCIEGWFGPDCDIECGDACTDTKGQCLLSGPGCVCPRGMKLDGIACVTCGDGDCSNGECIDGRCQCDPGFYGDLCDISAPQFEGKVCNGFTHVVDENPAKVRATCSIANECTNATHEVAVNRAVAQFAIKFDLDMFCHRDDTPVGLKDINGCCIDRFATGFCEKDMLLKTPCVYNNGGEGEMVYDICNQRNLETEVNVYEWCLSRERGCTENGDCADPELCEHMCENQDPAVWQAYWENDHASSMTKLLTEQWRFPIAFEDPYEYRVPYADATIQGMCKAGGHYKTCRDHLIPDTSVFNVTHKYTGKWESMPSYSCGDVQFLSFDVQGTMNVSISPVMVGAIEVLLPNTAVFGRYESGGDVVFPSMVDSLTLFGKGEVQVVLYNSTTVTCTEFIRKAAEDWSICKDVTFFEFDYDWSGFCSGTYDTVGEFNETCYQQSKVCDGCENYQAGCVGLPVNMSSPMPAPCDQGWEEFCPGYLNGSVREGTCAYAKCECEGYGIGGPACSLQCPVPQGVTSELACGSGEDPPWGRCDDTGNGSVALGYEQGLCYCFNGGDPAKGCTNVCDASQDCSSDVDTPFSFLGNCSGYRNAKQDGLACSVNLTDSMCNYYRGRCECATPFTVYTIENQTEYMNPYGSYRVALMQGYEIDEYLHFTTHADPPSDLVAAFDNLDPGFKCFKDINHTQQVSCDWIRALKHFARGGSYRVGDCHKLAPGTTDQVPCSGHGFPVSGTCACDYAEAFEMRSSGVGLAFELPGLTETPWRGKSCGFLCPGYDMQSMDSVCSGHGLCESDGRCSCDQGYTGYKCDLSCEQTQEVLTCSGHGTCDERLYRRAGTDEAVLRDAFDTNCVNESMYLARDRVVEKDGVIYHMYEQLGLKVTEYPGTTRDATVEDYFIEGTAVRHPYGYVSDVPFMPCKDTILVKREEAILPSWAGNGTADVEISCSVLPDYEVRCGQCTCEETSQTGHWAGHDCRTPAVGHYGRDARSTCPGMVDGVPCNGGGTCMWGSLDGKGEVFKSDASVCYCGDPGPSVTLATAPRTSNNQFIVHAMNGDTPLYRKVVDSVPPVDDVCPDGTVGTDACKPADLALENYKNDCSCKFGWTGATCEAIRMMCLFSGTEMDGTGCQCRDNDGLPNLKVNDKGCCTKGTYWNQRTYRSFTLLTDFLEFGDTPLYKSEYDNVCAMAPTTTEYTTADMHDYIVNTDEYVLEPAACDGAEQVPLYNYVYRHGEDAVGSVHILTSSDPEQECLEYCGNLEKQGFNLKGTECRCLDALSFIDGNPSVFTSALTGSGKRYDIVYPSGCFESEGRRITSSKSGSSYYLTPRRHLCLEKTVLLGTIGLAQCVPECIKNGGNAVTEDSTECICGTLLDPCDNDNPPNGYIINTLEVAKHATKILPNPMPCNIDSYLAYPENMDNLCECPIWGYEECLPGTDVLLYNVSLDDKMATKHTCIAECTKQRKGSARIDLGDDFQCFCGDTCSDGTGAYRLEHAMFKLTGDEDATCVDQMWEEITDSSDCAAAARYINERGGGPLGFHLPTTVNPPVMIPNFLISEDSDWTPVSGCSWSRGGWNNADYSQAGYIDYLIYSSTGTSTQSTPMSTPICMRSQECECDGFYMRDGSAFTCPAGKFSDSCSSSCKECAVGTFSEAGASSCGECPGGWVQDGPVSCLDCSVGQSAVKGAHECTDCAAGKYNNEVGSLCDGCVAGQHQNEKGKTSCKTCEIGKYQDNVGGVVCKNCAAGQFVDVVGMQACNDCIRGQISAEGATDCTICEDGKYQDESGQTECDVCLTAPKPSLAYANVLHTVTKIEFPRVTSGTCESNGYQSIYNSDVCWNTDGLTTKRFGSDPIGWISDYSDPPNLWYSNPSLSQSNAQYPGGCIYADYPYMSDIKYFSPDTNSNTCGDVSLESGGQSNSAGGCICMAEYPAATCEKCSVGTHNVDGACKDCPTGYYGVSATYQDRENTCEACELPTWGKTLWDDVYSGWSGKFSHGNASKLYPYKERQKCVAYQKCPTSDSDRNKVESCNELFSRYNVLNVQVFAEDSDYSFLKFKDHDDLYFSAMESTIWSMCCVKSGDTCSSLYTGDAKVYWDSRGIPRDHWGHSHYPGNFNEIEHNGKILCDPTGVFDLGLY